jgi:hypothetical protein
VRTRVLTGRRVKLAPHLDLWMRGVRYATVVLVGRCYIHLLDDANREHRISVNWIDSLEVVE